MRARTGLWEPRVGNNPGLPGPPQVNASCQVQAAFATKSALGPTRVCKRWVDAADVGEVARLPMRRWPKGTVTSASNVASRKQDASGAAVRPVARV